MNISIMIAFFCYILILIFISLFFSKKNKTSSDFMLGSRSINYWVTAIALQSSDMSHWLFLSLPGAIYTQGITQAWIAIGLIGGVFLNWHFIAPKIRTETEKYNCITLFSYFQKKFNDNSGIIKITSACITLIFFAFYISSGLVALGRLFTIIFNMNYHTGVLIGLGTTVAYTLIGGFVAVAWCDFFQGLFLLVMIILVPLFAYFSTEGWSEIAFVASEKNISLSLFPKFSEITTILVPSLGWGLGYFGQPHILSFFMGIKDPKNISSAKKIGISWQIISLIASISVGVIGISYFSQGINDPEMIFVQMTQQLFAPLIAGFVLCSILAATLTTVDSQILTSGSIIAEDISSKLFKNKLSSKTTMLLSRVGSLLISIIALCIAWNDSKTIYDLVNYAWSGMGSAFGPLVIMSLYVKDINKYGAFTGIITGATVSAVWPYFNTDILPLIPGFLLSGISIYTVSYITKEKNS